MNESKRMQQLAGLITEALDPVGQEDSDVNNDGEVDNQDKYLMKHRAAIAKATAMEEGQGPNGKMAKAALRDMIGHAVKLYNTISPEQELSGWVAAYITLAADYIHSVEEYMDEENAEKPYNN